MNPAGGGGAHQLPHELRVLRVLIVDDNDFVLDIIQEMLRQMGLTDVHQAQDGEAALAFVHSSTVPVGLVICDLAMEGMDGIALLRHLGDENFRGGVIILSGSDSRLLRTVQLLLREHHLRHLDVMRKPPDPVRLQAAISKLQLGAKGDTSAAPPPTSAATISAAEIDAGIKAECVQVVFQPKVPIDGSGPIAAECLLRWRDPERGWLPPSSIVQLAEAHGLVDTLTLAVFRKATMHLAQWVRDGYHGSISVNISMQDLTNLNLPDVLMGIALAAGADLHRITLEITENQMMHQPAAVIDVMARLRLCGFGLSVDDYGTGHSSMERLKELPFTELKIDRQFVAAASTDAVARIMMESSVRLGHDLGLRVVAEGAETIEDWEAAIRAGCDDVQGFVLARPMTAEEFFDWQKSWETEGGSLSLAR